MDKIIKGTITENDLMFLHSILTNIKVKQECFPDISDITICNTEIVYQIYSSDNSYVSKAKRMPYKYFAEHIKHLIQATLEEEETGRIERLFPATLYVIPTLKIAAFSLNPDDVMIRTKYNAANHKYMIDFIDN